MRRPRPWPGAARHHLDILPGPQRAVAARAEELHLPAAGAPAGPSSMPGPAGTAPTRWPSPGHAAGVLARPEILEVADRYRYVSHITTTGRGFSIPPPHGEAAVETDGDAPTLPRMPSPVPDLLHGPFAMIDEDRPVIAIASQGAGGRALQPVLERLAERGADVCLVGDAGAARPQNHAVPLPAVSEQLAPVLEILPLQRLAHAMAAARHRNPDAPRACGNHGNRRVRRSSPPPG